MALRDTHVRGYHPLRAVAAGTGDVLMARLRAGRANTARGAAHFLTETTRRVRFAGAIGQLTVRADSGFYAHAVVAIYRKMDVRFSITLRQGPATRRLIEAIPEVAWIPIPYWIEGRADVPGGHLPGVGRTRRTMRDRVLLGRLFVLSDYG
jgi:Transposase DDE domain group 1